MAWVVSLNQNASRDIAAPGASCDLDEQLESSLACAKIGDAERRVCVDDSNERPAREVMALGDHLCSDENVHLACTNSSEDGLDLLAARDVTIQPGNARLRKGCRQRIFQLFGPDPLEHQRLDPAPGATKRQWCFVVAIMAAHDRGSLVERQRDRTSSAGRDFSAPVTPEAGRKAASVQKEDDLLVGAQRVLNGTMQRHTDARIARRPRAVAPEVDDLYARQWLCARALRDPQPDRSPRARHVVAFERWGAAAKHANGRRAMRAPNRHVASVVAHPLFLLEARVVLLVHDEKPQGADGCEKRAARANRHLYLARPQLTPHRKPFAGRECRMQNRDLVAEPGSNPGDQLPCQPNLGTANPRTAPPPS